MSAPIAAPAQHELGCPKCRWSLKGCQKCRESPYTGSSARPPLNERPGARPRGRRAHLSENGDVSKPAKKSKVKAAKSRVIASDSSSDDEYEAVDEKAAAAASQPRPVERASVIAIAKGKPKDEELKQEVQEEMITVLVRCGERLGAVMGRKGETVQALRWKSGASIERHPTEEDAIVVSGSKSKVIKAKALISEVIAQAEAKAKAKAESGPKSLTLPQRKSLDVMSIVKEIRRDSNTAAERQVEEENKLSDAAKSALQDFTLKLQDLTRSRSVMFQFTQDALDISKYEGIPEACVRAIKDRIEAVWTSAPDRLTLFYLLDSVAQASRVESRGGSHALHATFARSLSRHIRELIKAMIAVVKVDETQMKNIEVPEGASLAEAHARHRRKAVQKVLAIWEGREVLSKAQISAAKNAISEYRHENLIRHAREFDKKLERQAEPKVKVQADGLHADEFDDLAAMLGNQYGSAQGIVSSRDVLASLRAPMTEQASAPTSPASPPISTENMDWSAPMSPSACTDDEDEVAEYSPSPAMEVPPPPPRAPAPVQTPRFGTSHALPPQDDSNWRRSKWQVVPPPPQVVLPPSRRPGAPSSSTRPQTHQIDGEWSP